MTKSGVVSPAAPMFDVRLSRRRSGRDDANRWRETAVSTASKILVVAGMINLLIGALSGIPMGLVRQGGAPVVPKYLTMVHLGGLMHGPLLLGIAFALTISTVSPWIATAAALTLAIASGLLVIKDTLNWQQGSRTSSPRSHSGCGSAWCSDRSTPSVSASRPSACSAGSEPAARAAARRCATPRARARSARRVCRCRARGPHRSRGPRVTRHRSR